MKIVQCHVPLLLAVLLAGGCGAVRTPVPAGGADGSQPGTAEDVSTREKTPPPAVAAGEAVEPVEEFWDDGTPRIRCGVIRDGSGGEVFHGSYLRWHPNGEKEYEVVFDHGRKNGRAVRYHRNGRVWIEEHYVMGLKEGACRTWNEEGELVKEEQFAGGKPHGVWTVWEDGRIWARSCYDHGVPVECPPETREE